MHNGEPIVISPFNGFICQKRNNRSERVKETISRTCLKDHKSKNFCINYKSHWPLNAAVLIWDTWEIGAVQN